MSCPICLELFDTTSSISALDCGHAFHSNCILEWNQVSKTCPQCRKYIFKKIPIYFKSVKRQLEEKLNNLRETSLAHGITFETNSSKLVKQNLKYVALCEKVDFLEELIRMERGNLFQGEEKLKFNDYNKNVSSHTMKLKRDIKIYEMKIYQKQNLLKVFRANHRNLEARYSRMKRENKRLKDELKSLQLSISNKSSKSNCNLAGKLGSKIPVWVEKSE